MISTIKKDVDITKIYTIQHLADLLNLDLKSLHFFAYGNDELYKSYKIPKKSGGYREIHAPIEALKTTCKKLDYHLSRVYEDFLPGSAHGFITGRGIITNSIGHVQRSYVLNIDLQDFFGVVNSGRIMGMFKRYPFQFSSRLASVLTGLVTYKNSLPQGSPSSPVLANMVCLKLDKDLIRLSARHGWRYTRYADDITFSTNELSENLASLVGSKVFVGNAIVRIIEKNGFSINEKKTRLSTPHQSKWVTGIKVNEKLNLSRKYIKRVRSMLHAWEVWKEELAEKRFNSEFNSGKYKSFRQVLRGRIDHIGNVRGKDDLLYKKLYNRLCDLEERSDRRLPETKKEEYLNKVLVIVSSHRSGSGFFISKNHIVTCAHVVGSDRSVQFTTKRYRMPIEFKWASVIAVDEKNDYAILHTPSDNSKLVFKTNPRKTLLSFSQEEEYISVGYAGFRDNGSIWTDPAANDQKIIQKYPSNNSFEVGGAMWRGMSGGPFVSKRTDCVDGYIVVGARSLSDSADVKSHTIYPLSNIPLEYFDVDNKKVADAIPF